MQTKEITTPSGVPVTIKSLLSYDDVSEAVKIEDNFKKSEELIKVAVVSVNGVAENAYAALRRLAIADYNFVAREVTAVMTGNFQQGK